MTDQYEDRDARALGQYYTTHLDAMTSECLYDKHEIAAELAHRDREIDYLSAKYATMKARAQTLWDYMPEMQKYDFQRDIATGWFRKDGVPFDAGEPADE